MKIFPYLMNRKNYALTNILAFPVFLLLIVTGDALFGADKTLTVAIVAGALLFLTYLISSLERLSNIGKSKVWVIGIYIPLINLYVVPMLWSYPPKAKEAGLDKKAYMIFVVVLLVVLLISVSRLVATAVDTNPSL